MRIVGRLAQVDDQKFFLGRVIVATARGYPVEANPKSIQDSIAVLGLEESRPVAAPRVKRTPTTESLVELENDTRALSHGKAVYMCQKRTTLAYVHAKSNIADWMTKCHTYEAHMEGCAMLGQKLSRDDGKLA